MIHQIFCDRAEGRKSSGTENYTTTVLNKFPCLVHLLSSFKFESKSLYYSNTQLSDRSVIISVITVLA
jgi:hypothetical protein